MHCPPTLLVPLSAELLFRRTVTLFFRYCVTRRKQQRPGIASNDNTMHVPTTRSCADLTKPNHTPTRHIRAKEKIVLQMATPQASSSQRTRIRYCVTRRKLQTPGTAEEHKRQETPAINPNDRQPTQLYCVLHGETSKRLASPRNTKDRKHLQSSLSAQPTHLTDQAPSTTEWTARETHNTT